MLARLFGGGTPEDNAEQAKQQQAVGSPPPIDWFPLILRILQVWAIYFSLIPLIVAIACHEAAFEFGLIFGVTWSGFFLLLNTALWVLKRWTKKREPPYYLDGIQAIYFAVYLAVYKTKEEWGTDMEDYFNVTFHAWLSFMMFVSIAVRYPFTKQNAKEVAPEIAWGAPSFRGVCDQLAVLWATSQAVTCLLCVAPLMKESSGTGGLNVSFNYVVPYVMIVAMLVITRWYPRFIRAFWYLPRMHQGTVQPGGEPKPGEPGSALPGSTGAPGNLQQNQDQNQNQNEQQNQNQNQNGQLGPAPGPAS